MHKSGVITDKAGKMGQESDDIMFDLALDLVNFCDIKFS